jgi:sugar/nucleoside kinase (ribokinase family)
MSARWRARPIASPKRFAEKDRGVALDSVLVIGDVITDIIVRPQGPINWGSDTQAGIQPMPGGSGPNQAAWLATAGVPTFFLGRVGAADIAHSEAELRDFGVEPVLAADPELPTGMLVVLISPDGERSFLTDRGANRHLARADLPDHLLGRAGLLHISGYALFDPGPRAAVLDFARTAKSLGVRVTVDPASVGYLREVGPGNFLDWTQGMHICFPNADEAELLTGTADPERQLASLAQRYDLVVIKRGAAGAMAGNAAGERWRASARAVAAVDTVGAGDAFYGFFAAGYFRGHPLQACLEDGIEAGTRSTTIAGGRPPRHIRVDA